MADRTKNKNTNIGQRIKLLRLKQGFTQKDLAASVNKSESTVRMWELGKSEPDIDTIILLAKSFDVSIDKLFNYNQDKYAFNQRLKELRAKRNLSQQALADKIGISKSSINMYERGEREPSIETLKVFADFFNVDMNHLLGYPLTRFNMTVGERIKYLRKEKQLSQENLAELLKSTKQAIYKYENSIVTNIPIDKIKLLSNIFGVSPAYLMGWEDISKRRLLMPNELSIKLYNLRKKHNLTLEEVAKVVGVGKSTVKKWETGMIANMKRDKIALLAQALHTTPAYLMGWEDNNVTPSPSLSATETALLELFRQIPADRQEMVLQMIRAALSR